MRRELVIKELLSEIRGTQHLLMQNNDILNLIFNKSIDPLDTVINTVENIQGHLNLKHDGSTDLTVGLKHIKQSCIDAMAIVAHNLGYLYVNEVSAIDMDIDTAYALFKELEQKSEMMLSKCVCVISSVWLLLQEINERIREEKLYVGQSIREIEEGSNVRFILFRNLIDDYDHFMKHITRILRRLWGPVLGYCEIAVMGVVCEVISGYSSEEKERIEIVPSYNTMGPVKRIDACLFGYVLDDVLRNMLKYSDGIIKVRVKHNDIEVEDYGYNGCVDESMLYKFERYESKEYGDTLSYSRLMMRRAGGHMICDQSECATVFRLSFSW